MYLYNLIEFNLISWKTVVPFSLFPLRISTSWEGEMEKLFRFSARSLLKNREGERRTMAFPSQYLIWLCSIFTNVFLVMLERSSCFHQLARGADQPDVKVLAAVSQKTHFRRLTSKTSTETLQGQPLKRVKISLEIFTPSLFHSYCQSLALQAQMCRETSPSLESLVPFPLDRRAPQTVQRNCLLMCWLLSRKGAFPQPPLKLSLGMVLQGWICQMAVRVDRGAASAGSPSCLWWCDLSSCTCPWVLSYCSAPMTQI